jgi:hypothetical protein
MSNERIAVSKNLGAYDSSDNIQFTKTPPIRMALPHR